MTCVSEGVVPPPPARTPADRWLTLLVVLLFGYNLAACLEVAVVHLLEYPRYSTVQMYFTLLAQFFALWFVAEIVLEARHSLVAQK